jgi:hypothetical protein
MKIIGAKYENQPVRCPALEALELAAERRAVTEKYRNMVKKTCCL